MNIKNAEYKNIENTIVDVEIEHPQYGWIPYTFKGDDPDESFDVEIREWLKTATIEDYVEPVKSTEELITEYKSEVQRHVDSKAQSLGYDDINSIAKYIGYDNTYRAEAESLGAWTASCWDYCYAELILIENGTREIPTVEEFLAELPIFE